MRSTHLPMSAPKRSAEAHELLPLTPVVLHILLALADDAADGTSGKHGYAVAQEVEAMTDGQVRMGPGTLYGSIQRILTAALIEEIPRRRETTPLKIRQPSDDERRRYYRLTPLGRRALELEVARLARVVVVARSKDLLTNAGAA